MTDIIITLIIINIITIYAGIRSEMKYRRQHATIDIMGMMVKAYKRNTEAKNEDIALLTKEIIFYKERAEVLEMHKHDLERESPLWEGKKWTK